MIMRQSGYIIEPRKKRRTLIKQDIYNCFLQWYVLPVEEKKDMGINSESDFAKTNNISRKQLWIWKNRPEFNEDVINALKTNAIIDQVKLYHSIFEKAKKSYKYAKLWFDLYADI